MEPLNSVAEWQMRLARHRRDHVRKEFGTSSASLERRRWIARLSAVAIVDAAVVALRQMGALRHLPDPPGRVFDSDAVTNSRPAYVLDTFPDAALATAHYSLNFIAASAGATASAGRSIWWSRLLLANACAGAAGATFYLYDMLARRRRLCAWCLAAITVNFLVLPLAFVEAADESG